MKPKKIFSENIIRKSISFTKQDLKCCGNCKDKYICKTHSNYDATCSEWVFDEMSNYMRRSCP